MDGYELLEMMKPILKKWVEALIKDGILKRISSFSEYGELVLSAKKRINGPIYSNCYLRKEEIERLIQQKRFYQFEAGKHCLMFLEDQHSHYQGYYYGNVEKPLNFSRLDRSILIEDIYRKGSKSRLSSSLVDSGFHFYDRFQQFGRVPHMECATFWNLLNSGDALLRKKGLWIDAPDDEELRQFQKIYQCNMDIYSQTYYTLEERRLQNSRRQLLAVKDKSGKLYAIWIDPSLRGEAIVSDKTGMFGFALVPLLLHVYRAFYENIPNEPEKVKEYLRPRTFAWVADSNHASRKMQERLKMQFTDKLMEQYIISGFCT